MNPPDNKNKSSGEQNDFIPAPTGNASNPSFSPEENEATAKEQVLSSGAEKYLREAGNIEDMPGVADQQQMDETIKQETSH